MTVRVRTPVRQVHRPPPIRVVPQTEWDRSGRQHFLNRDAFDVVRYPIRAVIPGWLWRMFGGG
jgi:hypothetical protein